MSNLQFEWLTEHRDRLGESPVWDQRRQTLFWIDSKRCLVQALTPSTGDMRQWVMPAEVGSLALCESGRVLVALEDDIGFLDPEAPSANFQDWVRVSHPEERMRLNDGRVDRQGRFLVGSMKLAPAEPVASLYQVWPSGEVRELETGIRISNTLALSPKGESLYFADSLTHQIRCYDYETMNGQLSGMSPFANTEALGSGPDGAAVDAQGRLWVALVLTGQIACFKQDGSLERVIDVPTPYPSCVCFGGDQLDTLFVTSLSDTGNAIKTDDPRAGRLLAVKGLGAQGLPESRFADVNSCAATVN